jgi:hypothetical protein
MQAFYRLEYYTNTSAAELSTSKQDHTVSYQHLPYDKETSRTHE